MFTLPEEKRAASGTVSYLVGVGMSLTLHVSLAIIAVIVLEHSRAKASELVEVFSVTLEGGEKLGGINQIPSSENIPPPKVSPVSNIERREETQETQVTKKEEKSIEKVKEKETTPEEQKELEDKPTEETELPEMKQRELQEAAMIEENRRREELKKKEEAKRKEEERKLKEQKDEEEKKIKVENEKKKKEQEEKERADKEKADKEKKEQAQRDKEKKEREDKFRKAIESAQLRSEGTSKSDYKGESVNAGGQGWGAAALGGKGMGGGTVRPLEFVAYVNRLEQHIKGGWHWIKGGDRLQAVIFIRLAPSGVVQEASIERGSGNGQFDDSALRAVYKASPVPPPPESLYNQFRETRITFDSQE